MKLFTPCPIEFQALFHDHEIRSRSPSICTIIVARQQDIYRLSYYVQVALQYARMRVVGDIQWYYVTDIGIIRMAGCPSLLLMYDTIGTMTMLMLVLVLLLLLQQF